MTETVARDGADRDTSAAVVCSILERTVEQSIRSLVKAPDRCALVEIRADYLRVEQVTEVVARAGRPAIVTIRRCADGGAFDGSEEDRRSGLLAALDAGARFIDVEWGSALEDLAAGEHARRVVLSHHGTDCESSALESVYREMAATVAARAKLVSVARSPGQLAAVRDLLAQAAGERMPLACFAMGRAGAVSRLMAPAWGSWATFGSLRAGIETAPGQFSAAEMLETHDVLRIGPDTRFFALIGESVFGSPSPAMHHAGYRDAGLDARYFPLELDRLEDCLPLAWPRGTVGFEALAVTIPFKEAAAARCRLEDDVARSADAVNTVIVGAEGWRGYNTDGPAVLQLVSRHLSPRGANVSIVGAGGTARAAAAALHGAGSRVTVFNRTLQRAEEIAESIGVAAADLTRLGSLPWDVLVQATPLGKAGERILSTEALVGTLVIDAVYGPETPLVRDARQAGLQVVDGLELLVAQAVLQYERMTGRTASAELFRNTGERWLAGRAASLPDGSRGSS